MPWRPIRRLVVEQGNLAGLPYHKMKWLSISVEDNMNSIVTNNRDFIKYISIFCILLNIFGGGASAVTLSSLPEPVTNNAVAELDGRVFSFGGLYSSKDWRAVTADAVVVDLTNHGTSAPTGVTLPFLSRLPPLPDGKGRLASVSVTVGKKIYIFGGYTVDKDGTEVSTDDVWAFDPATANYTPRAPIPVAVDDTVALAYKDRYIYLISGWHNNGNVTDVQTFDTLTNRWFQATPFPGQPVFGHAGGIEGNRFVIIDGVIARPKNNDGRSRYELIGQTWKGEIDPENPAIIRWRKGTNHPGAPLYRAAARGGGVLRFSGTKYLDDSVVFAGGATNPYNYNGIGYNQQPSEPSSAVYLFNLRRNEWKRLQDLPIATMDHRGLIALGAYLCTAGGMTTGQKVTAGIHCFHPRSR